MKPRYIAFEGVEGCGKSTLATMLHHHLKTMGIENILTREPGGTEIGKALRRLITEKEMDPVCELFLFLADRAEHMEKVVKPALENGLWVISDRCYLSTIAYQGYARKAAPIAEIKRLCLMAAKGITPDVIFLIDIDPALSLKRLKKPDRIEAEKLSFHQKVREGFLHEARQNPSIHLLNGSAPPDALLKELLPKVLQLASR